MKTPKKNYSHKTALAGLTAYALLQMPTAFAISASHYSNKFSIELKNALNIARQDEVVTLSLADIKQRWPDFNYNAYSIWQEEHEIPSQTGDTDADGIADEIVFITSLKPREKATYTIRYNSRGKINHSYPKRTQAEIGVRVDAKMQEHQLAGGHFESRSVVDVPTDHFIGDGLLKYEGAGWESDKIAYRLYLDERFRIDIFGKKTADMVLQNVGQPGDNYHKMSGWGMDILHVGDSLGIGALGMLDGTEVQPVEKTAGIHAQVVENGPVRSQLRVQQKHWSVGDNSYDLTSDIQIHAGSRLTHYTATISGQPDNLVTGIVKNPPIEVLLSTPGNNGSWKYIATFGQQSLAQDDLGMAILYRQKDLIALSESDNSYILSLKPEGGKLEYYLLGAWTQEHDGITSASEFRDYLETATRKLNSPIQVKL